MRISILQSIRLLPMLLVISCALSNQQHVQSTSVLSPASSAHILAPVEGVLGVGDVLAVRVYQEKELSGSYRIGNDGSIAFPLIGRLDIVGLNQARVEQLISAALSKYVKYPDVSVTIKEFNSQKVFVYGEVKRPGTFKFESGLNIVQVITMAGGFSKFGERSGVLITRIVGANQQKIKVSVRAIGNGKAPNVLLFPGDIIFVPEALF